VEPEIAHDESAILDRISGTVRLNVRCRVGAARRGIADRLMPVIQGWKAEHYLRCIDRMPFVLDAPLVGVGSMCRRHVQGENGILRIVDELDRAFAGTGVRLHLFGLKSDGMAAVRGHSRIASCDSQAYGLAARHRARKDRCAKTDAMLAATMADWYRTQRQALDRPDFTFRPPVTSPMATATMITSVEARIAAAAEELRRLHEAGEIGWTDLSPLAAYQMAFLDDDPAD